MSSRTTATCFAFAVATLVANIDIHGADAQGLIRRIQRRIESLQSAAAPLPQQQPSSAAPAANSPPAAQPRRVRPILPALRAPTPSNGPGAASAGSDKPNNRVISKYGRSILAPADPLAASESTEVTNANPTGSANGRPSMGIDVYQSRTAIAGVLVAGIHDGSLADEAGLRMGDIIVAIDGVKTPTIASVSEQLNGKQFGQKVEARIVRGTATKQILIPMVGNRTLAAKASVGAERNNGPSPPLATPPLAPPHLPRRPSISHRGM